MAQETLKIVINADNKQAVAAMRETITSLKGVEVASGKAGAAVSGSKRNYTELSRVVQDLPFGFTAISNNLTQLIPAAGAAGLAFSALVAALTFAQTGFANWTRGANKATKASKEFSDELNNVKASALSTGVQLQAFVKIAQDSNAPLSQRNQALKEANKLMGEHGDKLTLVNINSDKARQQVELLTQALIQQAVAAKLGDKAADLAIKQLEASRAYGEAAKNYKEAQKNYGATEASSRLAGGFVGAGVGGGRADLAQEGKKVAAARSEYEKSIATYKEVTVQLKQISADQLNASKAATAAFSQLPEKVKPLKDAVSSARLSIRELLSEFERARLASPSLKMTQTVITNEQQNTQVGSAKEAATSNSLFNALIEERKKKLQELTAEANMLRAAFDQTLGPAIDNVFNAMANGDNIGKTLGETFKRLAVQIAAAAAKALIFKAILGAVTGGASAALPNGGGSAGGGLGSLLGMLFRPQPTLSLSGNSMGLGSNDGAAARIEGSTLTLWQTRAQRSTALTRGR
jgi:hypothetical protein